MIGGYFGGGGEIKQILKDEDVIAKIPAIVLPDVPQKILSSIWHNFIGLFHELYREIIARGVQASQLIQARCSEITSPTQTHPSQKDSAESDADHSWPKTWPPCMGQVQLCNSCKTLPQSPQPHQNLCQY